MKQEKIIENLEIKKIRSIGFQYDQQNQCYIYDFPVYKYKSIPLLYCKMIIYSEDQLIKWSVLEPNGSLYPSYYNRNYGKNKILNIIDKNIKKKLCEIGGKTFLYENLKK